MDLERTQADNLEESKLRQMSKRFCRNQNHFNSAIQILCLEESCQANRLLCLHCFFEGHKTHNTTLIFSGDNSSNPIRLLKMNSQRSDGKHLQKSLNDCHSQILEKTAELQQIIKGCLNQVKSNICFEICTLCKTLNEEEYQKAIKEMLESENEVDIESYVKMLKFLKQFKQWSNNECFSQIVNTRKRAFIFMLQEFKIKIKALCNLFFSDVSKISMNKCLPSSNNGQKKKTCSFLEIMDIEQKKEQGIIKKYRKCNQGRANSMHLKRNLSKNFRSILNNNFQNIIVIQDQSAYQQQQVVQIKQPQLQTALTIFSFDEQMLNIKLNEKLNQTKHNVQKIAILNDTNSKNFGQEAIKTMIRNSRKKLSNLKSLTVSFSNGLNKYQITRIARVFSKLQQLILNCQGVKRQLTLIHLIKYLPAIRRLNFGLDTLNQLQNSMIAQQFFNLNTTVRLNLETCLKLSKQLPNLQNIQISIFESDTVEEIIRNMKNLKQISIGQQFFVQNKENPIIEKLSFFDVLAQKTDLLSLTINSINFSKHCQLKFADILKCFANLKVLQLLDVKGVSDEVIKAVQNNCRHLKALSLYYNDQITGKNIWQMAQLNSLTICACWGICSKFATSGIKQMNNLKMINISFNYNEYKSWITPQFFRNIGSNKGLQHLIINNNQICDEELVSLGSFDKLKTLICGQNKITGHGLHQFLKKNSSVQKLSICGLNADPIPINGEISSNQTAKREYYGRVTDQQFLAMTEYMTSITHLNTCMTNKINLNRHFDKLPSLRLLCYTKDQLSSQNQRKIKSKGVMLEGHSKSIYQDE